MPHSNKESRDFFSHKDIRLRFRLHRGYGGQVCYAGQVGGMGLTELVGQAPPYNYWIPAFAGMTLRRTACYGGQAK